MSEKDANPSIEYHLYELAIATDIAHERRALPSFPAGLQRILDVGCGIGQSLIALELPQTTEAFGVDIDTAAIAFGSRQFPHLKLAVSGGENLPFADASFDALICRVALPYMDVPRAMHEFARVLKPGGALWLTVHPMQMLLDDLGKAVRSGDIRSIVYRSYTLINSLLLIAGFQFRYPLNRSRMESYQMMFAINRACSRAGFTEIEQRRESGAHIVLARKAAT